uniref:Uncharacterized protein n=1 Tax=uncultured gamma proteobacterium EB750_07C09 TaxID=710974 RepID=E0Y3D5_9GAMM|nr:hypothetical protein [uncultured gamma proteobacterium EB750_07C09]
MKIALVLVSSLNPLPHEKLEASSLDKNIPRIKLCNERLKFNCQSNA